MDEISLKDIVIVNESRDEAIAGDICVFRSANAACDYLESWWVEDGHGIAFTGLGARLTLEVEIDRRWIGRFKKVVIAGQVEVPNGAEIVRGWLIAAARPTHRPDVTTSLPELPNSLEGLIRYVGFRA